MGLDENVSAIAKQAYEAAQESLRDGNLAVAEMRLKNAAALGNADAMVALGDAAHHRGLADAAWHWYQAAAEKGNAVALVRMGLVREAAGDETGKVHWFLRAVESGSRDAMFNMGNHHRDQGDFATAKSWYAKAAGLGDDDAMRLIGALELATGTLESALPWFEQASSAGNEEAADALQQLRGALNGDAESLVFVAWAFADRGNDREAARWKGAAVRAGVRNIDHRFGLHFEMVEKRDEAMASYSRSTLAGNRESLDGIMRLCDTEQFLQWVIGAIERGDRVADEFMTEFRRSNGFD